jgi:hypothetical protein
MVLTNPQRTHEPSAHSRVQPGSQRRVLSGTRQTDQGDAIFKVHTTV